MLRLFYEVWGGNEQICLGEEQISKLIGAFLIVLSWAYLIKTIGHLFFFSHPTFFRGLWFVWILKSERVKKDGLCTFFTCLNFKIWTNHE